MNNNRYAAMSWAVETNKRLGWAVRPKGCPATPRSAQADRREYTGDKAESGSAIATAAEGSGVR